MTARILSKSAPWRYEIRFRWPDRTLYRERRRATVTAKSAAQREADDRETYVRAQGKGAIVREKAAEPALARVPTLREFGPRWIEGHARASRQKRSGIASKEGILKNHLYPSLGHLPLDKITTERVAKLSAGLAEFSRKTLANVLATLAKLLRTAVDWDVLSAMPCKIKIPKAARTPPTFYEQDVMRCLIKAAAAIDARTHALVLLGLHAGLRRGEILGLEWSDVNLARRQIVIRRNAISRYVDTPKSGHGRVIDLSAQLTSALEKHRQATPSTGSRVMLQDTGRPALAQHLYAWTRAAMDAAGIPRKKGVVLHVMRHSACSALATMGAPMIAIQALAGHESPQTTAKYMHLAAGVQAAAVRLFDQDGVGGTVGARLDSSDPNP
jgi:integrase